MLNSSTNQTLVLSSETAEKQDHLGNILLSLSFFLIIIEPLYSEWAIVTQLIIVFSGVVLVLKGRYGEKIFIILSGLFFYTSIIIVANGGDSFRLGVISAIFFGLFFTKSKVYSFILIASIYVIGYLLYTHTDGFTKLVSISEGVSEGSSINYFSQALFYVLIAGILSETNKRASYLAFAILVAAIFTGSFVPSRQIAIVAACAATYFILVGGHSIVKMAIGIAVIFFVLQFNDYNYKDIAFVAKFFDRGTESLRSDILNCYTSNFSPVDLFIGSDKTESGRCAMKILDTSEKYLHNGYLETQGELGLLGFMMIIFYPISLVYFAIKSNLNIVFTLAFVGLYQMVEGKFMWIYFFILFQIIGEILRFKRHANVLTLSHRGHTGV